MHQVAEKGRVEVEAVGEEPHPDFGSLDDKDERLQEDPCLCVVDQS